MTAINKSRRVLLICNEAIGPNMAGPAIRYWEFARVLSNYFTVVLAMPPFVQAPDPFNASERNFAIRRCRTTSELQALIENCDVMVTVGANLSIYPFLADSPKPLVVDMYIPLMLEGLQKHLDKDIHERHLRQADYRKVHTLQIRAADFIICASDKQKDFWLGWLAALGRVNPYTHRDDPTLARLIEIVPFGLPSQAPLHTQPALKGAYKTIAADDKVILWGGGIWDWLDPYTLIRAVASISRTQPKVKLFFMGIESPNPISARVKAAAQAIQLSQELGVYDKHVFFHGWTPYHERQNYLLEADIGATLHLNHLETRFAFRTRFLDYLWAGLPIVTTAGDAISEVVARWELGKVVKCGDVDQTGQALLELMAIPDLRQQYQPHFNQIRAKYEWETVLTPLIKFCEAPYQAPDKAYLKNIPWVEGEKSWPGKVLHAIRNYGISGLVQQTRKYIRWKLQK